VQSSTSPKIPLEVILGSRFILTPGRAGGHPGASGDD
jgi:hypothetical protein